MSIETLHFLITPEGGIREFSAEQASMVAAGASRLPEFAQQHVRYLQVTVCSDTGDEIKVQTTGATIGFDREGKLSDAGPPREEEPITRFELDACVQWALKRLPNLSVTFH